jgi:hypothetical protein
LFVAHTGCIDWRRMGRSKHFINLGIGLTYVYAFWVADQVDIDLLRPDENPHDIFCAGPDIDNVLLAGVRAGDIISPNLSDAFEPDLMSKPLLGALCLGTADAVFVTADLDQHHWWADHSDLTPRGRLMLHELDRMYGRKAVLLTFLDLRSIKPYVPEATGGLATVASASGQFRASATVPPTAQSKASVLIRTAQA